MDSWVVIVAIAVVALIALIVALVALRRDPLATLAREFAALKGGISADFGHTHQRLQSITDSMAVIDSARVNIENLAKVLGDRKTLGVFGQIQMEDLVRDILPAGSYAMQATLANNRKVDCLIRFSNPPGPISVDAKFPLESFQKLRAAANDAARAEALRAFKSAIAKHVEDIAGKYIVAGETADWALMFVPSEAVYAEIHASLPETVADAHRLRVGIVSPTTLMAVLTTVRAIVMDAQMVAQAEQVKAAVEALANDARLLDERAEELDRAFNQTVRALREVRTSAGKITKKITDISKLDLSDN